MAGEVGQGVIHDVVSDDILPTLVEVMKSRELMNALSGENSSICVAGINAIREEARIGVDG